MDVSQPTHSASPAIAWLETHGDALYAYAIQRVRRPEIAEDLVQETLLAGLAAENRFDGRSAERTWLIGILRHKIVDHLRRAFRQRPISELEADPAINLFDEGGAWKVAVPEWQGTPGAQLERAEFRAVLASCLEKLPPRLAELFWLREAEEMDTETLCQELGVSPTNIWTMLHRARARLRQCLTVNWFGGGDR
jgi:RNA polymerase sigma-70 factor (ECF subfamily)